jgi:hypothetical protein
MLGMKGRRYPMLDEKELLEKAILEKRYPLKISKVKFTVAGITCCEVSRNVFFLTIVIIIGLSLGLFIYNQGEAKFHFM